MRNERLLTYSDPDCLMTNVEDRKKRWKREKSSRIAKGYPVGILLVHEVIKCMINLLIIYTAVPITTSFAPFSRQDLPMIH